MSFCLKFLIFGSPKMYFRLWKLTNGSQRSQLLKIGMVKMIFWHGQIVIWFKISNIWFKRKVFFCYWQTVLDFELFRLDPSLTKWPCSR